MTWITIKQTGSQWEVELMQQLLSAHGIEAKVVSQGLGAAYLGSGSPSALQVRPQDQWTAMLLLSPVDDPIDSGHSIDDENDDETHHTCIFADIQTLGKETAHCVVHNRECPVPQVDVFICGVSCKDVSRQNPSRDMSKHVLAEGQSRGGTAQTWQGFSSYVSMKQPGIVVFELLCCNRVG